MESCIMKSYNVLKFLNCEKYLFVKKTKTKQNKTKTKKHTKKMHAILWLQVAKVFSWGLALKGLTFGHQYYIRSVHIPCKQQKFNRSV